MSILLREATGDDLQQLDAHPPIAGLRSCDHKTLLANSKATSLLVAFVDTRIVGHVNVRWTFFRTPQFAEAYPRTPVMNGLGVWPESARNEGIGTLLIAAAEKLVRSNGFERIGLGIYVDNVNAYRLYERLGYQQWDGDPVLDENADEHPLGLIVMTKELR